MTEKKIYHSVIDALEETPRDLWHTSRKVSYALLRCPRVIGIVRRFVMRCHVDLNLLEEAIGNVAMTMQNKMLLILDDPRSVYSVIYKVAEYEVLNMRKKEINTIFSPEVSISDFSVNENDEDHDILERLSTEDMTNDPADEIEKKIDIENARKRFSEALARHGWPEHISRNLVKIGRPKKQSPLIQEPPLGHKTFEQVEAGSIPRKVVVSRLEEIRNQIKQRATIDGAAAL